MSYTVAFGSLQIAYSHTSHHHNKHLCLDTYQLPLVGPFRLVSLTTHLTEFLVPEILKPWDSANTTKLGQKEIDTFSTLKFYESIFSVISYFFLF